MAFSARDPIFFDSGASVHRIEVQQVDTAATLQQTIRVTFANTTILVSRVVTTEAAASRTLSRGDIAHLLHQTADFADIVRERLLEIPNPPPPVVTRIELPTGGSV